MEKRTVVFNGRKYHRQPDGHYANRFTFKGKTSYLHRDIWEDANGPIPEGYVVHHIDHDKENNDIGNLALMERRKHYVHHGETGDWQRSEKCLQEVLPAARGLSHVSRRKPENRAKVAERWKTNTKLHEWIYGGGAAESLVKTRELAAEWHRSEEGRAWHREHGKKCWENKPLFPVLCGYCGREFFTPFPDRAKFCHANCKMRARYRRLHPGVQPHNKKFPVLSGARADGVKL